MPKLLVDLDNDCAMAGATAADTAVSVKISKPRRTRTVARKGGDNVVEFDKKAKFVESVEQPREKAKPARKSTKKAVVVPTEATPAVIQVTVLAQPATDAENWQPVDANQADDDNAGVEAAKLLNHKHQHGESCEYCGVDEANLTAAYNVLKSRESARRKQAADLQRQKSEALPLVTKTDFAVDAEPICDPYKLIQAAVAVVCVALCAWVCIEQSNYNKGSALSDISTQPYTSIDGARTLDFSGHSLFTTNCGTRTHVADVHKWQDNYRDHLALMFGSLDNTLWLKSVPSGLEAPDGSMYYSSDAPELSTIQSMRSIRDGAQRMFLSQGRYPTDAKELLPYMVLGSVVPPDFKVTHEMGSNLVSQAGETVFEKKLKAGDKFTQEKAGAPNAISCMEVKSEPLIASDINSYGWRTTAFFVHGNDRNGKLLRSFGGDQSLLFVQKNGVESQSAHSKLPATSHPSSVTLYSGDMPSKSNLRLFYGGIIFLFLSIALFIYLSKIHRSAMECLAGPSAEA